ncbi:MAG: hypothetical protein U1C56_01640 [Candidatus Curtissbacteria bacterium]|nr:hypothetical protein [Candidatus Curtissbacteria bacterium]
MSKWFWKASSVLINFGVGILYFAGFGWKFHYDSREETSVLEKKLRHWIGREANGLFFQDLPGIEGRGSEVNST